MRWLRREAAKGAARGPPHDPYRTEELDIPIITWRYADAERQGVWMRADPLNGKYDTMHGLSTTVVGETGMIEVLGRGRTQSAVGG